MTKGIAGTATTVLSDGKDRDDDCEDTCESPEDSDCLRDGQYALLVVGTVIR